MKTTSLFQLGGIAVLLAEILFAIGNLMYFLSDQQSPDTLSLWIAISGDAFLVLGLIALYARQAQQSGVLGLIGFILLIWGNMASVGSEAVSLGVAQGVFSDEQLSQVPSYVSVGTIIIWIWVLGHIIFGVSIYRARVYSQYVGMLLALVGLVESLTGPLAFMRPIFAILSFVTWVWLGWALVTEKRAATLRPAPAV